MFQRLRTLYNERRTLITGTMGLLILLVAIADYWPDKTLDWWTWEQYGGALAAMGFSTQIFQKLGMKRDKQQILDAVKNGSKP